MRAAGVPLFSVEQHLPAAAFDVLAFNLSAELVYTNVVNLIDLAGVPLHAAERGISDALVLAGGHCAFNPEPLADFVDAFVLGDGEEVVGEINEVVREWLVRPEAGRSRDALRRALARARGRLRPRALRAFVRRRTSDGHRARRPFGAGGGVQAHRGRPGRLALPGPAPGAADRGRARPPERRGLPGLHPRLSLLPGGHDHPSRARAPRRAGPRHGAPRVGLERLRGGGAHLAVDRGLLGDRANGGRHRRGPRLRRPRFGQPALAPGGRVHRGHCCADSEGEAHRFDLRPRGGHLAHAHGDQQAHHRGGSLRRGRRRLQPGLAAHQALLPHRPAHRTRRGRAGHRRAGVALRRDRAALQQVDHRGGLGRGLRAQGPHAVPVVRPGHRGRARAQGGPAARRRPSAPGA